MATDYCPMCNHKIDWLQEQVRCHSGIAQEALRANERLTAERDSALAENREFRALLLMVFANLRNPQLGGLCKSQIEAIDEALGWPYDDDAVSNRQDAVSGRQASDPDFYDPKLPKFQETEPVCSQCGTREWIVKGKGCPESRGGCGRKPYRGDSDAV